MGRNLSIHFTRRPHRPVASAFKLGNSIFIGKDAWLNVSDPKRGKVVLVIDDNCLIGPRCQITGKNLIHLERGVLVSSSVLIMDHSHACDDLTRPIQEQGITEGGRIRIGQGSWVGHGAAIVCTRGELVLGYHSIVAANALVTSSCPPYSAIIGNPGKVITPSLFQVWIASRRPRAWLFVSSSCGSCRTVKRSWQNSRRLCRKLRLPRRGGFYGRRRCAGPWRSLFL